MHRGFFVKVLYIQNQTGIACFVYEGLQRLRREPDGGGVVVRMHTDGVPLQNFTVQNDGDRMGFVVQNTEWGDRAVRNA